MTLESAARFRIPLIRSNPPRLSRLNGELKAMEESGVFSNNGLLVRRFENEARDRLFGGFGGCVTVANATLGLMIALRAAADRAGNGSSPRLALMPSFTFAATAQAALWAGLTPLLCDIDEESWVPSARAEEQKLKRYGRRIAAIVPYATFGNSIDMERYAWLSRRHEVDVVVDAASSLGSLDAAGRGFGANSRLVSVFSMHATKTFATAEGGLIYSADKARLEVLRSMANYGFGTAQRSATMAGLNAKMSEVTALLALTKLRELDQVVERRVALAARYQDILAGFDTQLSLGSLQALQFMPVLLPRHLAGARPAIVARMAARGVGAGTYFSPHLAEQTYFRKTCLFGRLPVTADVAARVLALPLADAMTDDEVDIVCETLLDACLMAGDHGRVPAADGAPAWQAAA